MKKVLDTAITGQQGVNLIERRVLEMGFIWRPTSHMDVGIDGTVEIRDPESGAATGRLIAVQRKATTRPFQSENDAGFTFSVSDTDAEYWKQANVPVILVVCRPHDEEAYWLPVTSELSHSGRGTSRQLRYSKQRDRFDESCAHALAELASPVDSGTFLPPRRASETLYTNLLEVEAFPEKLYGADTTFRGCRAVWEALKTSRDDPPGDWIIVGSRIYSFRPRNDVLWESVCDPITIEEVSAIDWGADPDPDPQQRFTQLLNSCLAQKAWELGLHHSWRSRCQLFYFPARKGLQGYSETYTSFKQQATRQVFAPYQSRREPSAVAFYRHSAFEYQFRRFDSKWFLRITPTYHFTRDGYRADRYADDRLKKIKQFEHNPAVAAQLLMWAEVLTRSSLMQADYQFLTFGPLCTCEAECGVDDNGWLTRTGGDDELMPEDEGLFAL